MKPSRKSARNLWQDRLSALKNVPPCLRLLWETGPGLVSAGIALRFAVALVPLATLWVAKLIIDAVAAHRGVTGHIWILLGAEFALAAIASILGRVIDYCDGRLGDRFARDVSARVMQHAATLDLASFEDPVFYDRLERARVQANDRVWMLNAVGRLIQQSVTLISLAAGVFAYSPLLFLLLAGAVLPAFFGESHFAFLSYSLAYSLTPLRRELDYLRELGTKKESAKEVKLFRLGDFLRNRFIAVSDEVNTRNARLAARRLRAGVALSFIGSLGYYAAYAAVVLRALRGEISIGELTFLAGALAGCSSQIQQVFSTFTGIADQALYLGDLFHFFAMQPKILTREIACPAPRRLEAGFDFQNVTFVYPDTSRRVVDRLNFRIDSGESIAIVGENGQGKTTLVKLMTRLYDPTGGRILLDGVDLRDYDLESLHRKIGVIFQDFTRYDLTVRENIAAGRMELREDDAALQEAAMLSGADRVVERLPAGLEQMLGRRFADGLDLSGGEWQKMALARGYLRDAEILILDEPTASLDAQAEYEVFQRFADLTEGKMAILISHRFSTVRTVDRIVVLENGSIREQGTHDQLIVRGGSYARMFSLQASKYR
jgi:ATP-binding cassette, subfamily B, bacterial